MVAAAITSRPRATPAPLKKSRRSVGTYVIIGVPIMLLLLFAYQVASGLLHNEIAIRDAVAVSRVSLEPDQAGSRINLVLVDRVGQDTTVNGELSIKLREPDGTVWQTTRTVSGADFLPLKGGLLGGRMGYSVVIPATDWLRAPRRGGSATVSVNVVRADGMPFSTVAEERFP
jgi:hypothetical protein